MKKVRFAVFARVVFCVILPDDLSNLLTNDGDLVDGARYKLCCAALDDDVFSMWGLDEHVGVEFEPEGTFLFDGEVDLVEVEEFPIFLIVGGVNVDVVFVDIFALAVLGDAAGLALVSECKLGRKNVDWWY